MPARTGRAVNPLRRIRVLLCSPKSPGNIGAVARAVKNLGLGGFDLVEPVAFRDPRFLEDEARKLAAHAGDVLRRARSFASLDQAITPSTYLVATSARPGRNLPVSTPREAAPRLVNLARRGRVALLFGPEDRGLPNRLIARASEGLSIPASPRYLALNLAQAVMVVGYELRLASLAAPQPAEAPGPPSDGLAPASDLDALHHEAEEALGLVDFLKPHNRARVVSDLRALVARAGLSPREARMLRGICRQIRWLAGQAGRAPQRLKS